MINDEKDRQDAVWHEQLRPLTETPQAPTWLEARIAGALRSRGFLRTRSAARARGLWALAGAAACVFAFLAGIYFSRNAAAPRVRQPTQPEYLLLLYGGPGTPGYDSQDESALIREYSAWARQEHAAGRLAAAEKLNELSIQLSGPEGRELTTHEHGLGGFFLITAPNLQEALTIARRCPHLRHGGEIIVRPIDPT